MLAVPFSIMWDRLRASGKEPISPYKQSLGLLLIALSYFIIAHNVKDLGNSGLLAIKWLEMDLGVVPTEFQVLMSKTIDSSELRREIQALIEAKRQGQELDHGLANPIISSYIEMEIARLENARFTDIADEYPIEELNQLFRNALQVAWS